MMPRLPPRHVAHLGPDHRGPSGMPAVVRALLASPLARDWALDPITTYRPGSVGRRLRAALEGLLAFARWIGRHRAEGIVHVHAGVRGSFYREGLFTLLARALGLPVLFHVHAGAGDIDAFADTLDPARRRVFSWLLARPGRVVSVSAVGAAALERRFRARDVAVVPNAAPVVRDPAPATERRPGRILYLGGWQDPAKGGDVLLDALPRLGALAPGAEVDLAGLHPPPHVPDVPDLRVRALGWLGPEEKDAAFRDADVVVFPSLSEGLPVALLEAMAHARAIVATRVGGMPEVLDDGASGVLVPPADPAALAVALAALAADPPRRAALGAAAREHVVHLDEEEVAGRLGALYRELL